MMDITKSREEFEKWANRLPSISITGRLERCGENYVDDYHTVFWLAWKASRESIVLDLPEPGDYDYITQYAESVYMEIRTAGIRIKGESE
ncbi:hypothetical protein [Yersinia intermedia]|uniref:hypothetical protein n=1 Tax=Yersinia intermedia TaxID=631 RepID=UPI0011A416FB|nr:hypothetical protein [Yersinia intermedia]